MPSSTFSRRAVVGASVAALTLVTAAGTAQARIPGADWTGTVVITDNTTVTIGVGAPAAGRVTGTIQNRSGVQMRCSLPGPEGRLPNQVTDARVVKDAMDYYAANIYETAGVDVPMIGNIATGSMYNFMPTGSLSGSLGGATSKLVDLRNAQEAARVKGLTGSPVVGGNTDITVNNGATATWTADLGQPSSGVRPTVQMGALFFCEGGGNSYVFAGYQGGTVPTEPAPGIGLR